MRVAGKANFWEKLTLSTTHKKTQKCINFQKGKLLTKSNYVKGKNACKHDETPSKLTNITFAYKKLGLPCFNENMGSFVATTNGDWMGRTSYL